VARLSPGPSEGPESADLSCASIGDQDACLAGKAPQFTKNLKGTTVQKFVTIGYGDREGYDRTAVAVRDAAHAHDAKLQKDGALMGIAGAPVQVRNPDSAQVETADGPFMKSSLPVAGFSIIEAANLAEAVDIASRTPCAVAHGVVEVWPLK
jgi:hypothetical protein